MAKVVVTLQVRKAIWLTPCLRLIKLLVRTKAIPITIARGWAAQAVNRAIKYRVDNGRWKRFKSPIIPFVREF